MPKFISKLDIHVLANLKNYPVNIVYSFIILILTSIQLTSCSSSSEPEAQAPSANTSGVLEPTSATCCFDQEHHQDDKIILNVPKESQLIDIHPILQFSALPQNFKIYTGNVKTAIATIDHEQRILIFNPKETVSAQRDSNYWSTVFILAHEIGHHLAYNLNEVKQSLQTELDADKFAGSFYYRMGADSNQVLLALQTTFPLANADANQKAIIEKRLAVVKNSWLKASELRFKRWCHLRLMIS